jgi:uncharacterized protein YdeI (YjbR/CyaY-like superfamily)
MPVADDRALLVFEDRRGWREWLESHHSEAKEVWLVLYKKGMREGSLSLDEAVEEALCYGWIDGKLLSMDAERYSLRFTPRRADSVWSISNIRRVERLIQDGRMKEAGLRKIGQARQSGQWEAAVIRERTDVIPPVLEKALRRKKGAIAAYRSLNDSRKKQLLHWLFTARRPETRRKRIEAIVKEVGGLG